MKDLIAVVGPTATGKTEYAIQLAERLGGEIVSCDSMQLYKFMDIGSAKPSEEERRKVRHYLVDEIDPRTPFSVVQYQRMAKQAIQEIYAKGKIPIVVGGTGFYIQALLYDIDFTENEGNHAYRQKLELLAQEKGTQFLHDMLRAVDEKAAEDIHANNVKRVIRALEFYEETGTKISEHNEKERAKESPYSFFYFVLNDDRAKLYERIDRRIDEMIEEGLVEEVRSLKERGFTRDMVSMQGLGYKEILDYLNGVTSLEEAIYILKRDTRHFAKRQITWFKRERDVIWVNKNEFYYDEEKILQFLTEKIKKGLDYKC